MGKIVDERLKNIYTEKENEHYRIEISNGFRDDGTRDRIIEHCYGTEDEAIIMRDKIKAELKDKKEAGINASNDGYTLIEAAQMFLTDRKYKKRTGTTIKGYKRYLNDFILPEFGQKKLRNITEKDLEKLYSKMRKHISKTTGKPLSGTTIRHTHALIKAIYNYAIHKKWLLYNPAMHVDDEPKMDTPEREYYDFDEMNNAMSCLDKMPTHSNGLSVELLYSQNLRFKTAITILFNSGLRKEELFGLKWKDIKSKSKLFKIRRAVVNVEAKHFHPDDVIEIISDYLVCKDLKNDPSKRNITMPQICFDLLLEYKENQIKNGKNVTEEDYIFQEVRLKSIWNPTHLTKEWSRFIKAFNLKKITIHDIRHSHATYLLSIGVPIQDVSRRLGHSDIATTLKIYVHSNLEQDKKISNIMENNFYSDYVSIYNIDDYRLDFTVISSIVTGINFATDEMIHKGLEYLTNETITQSNLSKLTELCKLYILEKYECLSSISLFIDNNTNSDKNDAFFKLITKIQPDICKMDTIMDIEYYANKVAMGI